MEDLISRQAVIELCEGWWLGHTKEDDFATEIRALPSVRPKEKVGHWIEKEDEYDVYYDCSECGASFWTVDNKIFLSDTNYCPNCGAQMFDPQESEDKE